MAVGNRVRGSLRKLGGFLFRDVTREEFVRLFGRDAGEAVTFHLREWDEDAHRERSEPVRFLAKARFLIARILGQLSPARRLLFVVAFVLVVLSMFSRGNLPLWAFAILAFLLLLELSEKLLARDEIEVAREVQLGLFPQTDPDLPGWRLASRNVPHNDVGGDYYDYVVRRGGSGLGVALGDVAGKGMGAALLVANLQATLRSLLETGAWRGALRVPESQGASTEEPAEAHPSCDDMERLFAMLNRALAGFVQANRFASLVYGELERATGRFSYVNAGQNPPLVVRADGAVEWLDPGGMILGILPDTRYHGGEVTLTPGDALILYCDGVTERFDGEGREFGDQRLVDVAVARRGRPASELRDAILEAVERHGGGTRAHDDVTLVILSREAA